ncbi:MAG: FMN-binding negative transcriptional regulator [Rhodospirillaceae bacterium]|nr:FMN-binding negative transcriptional regulator [Rhodospirillaceae bacterium]
MYNPPHFRMEDRDQQHAFMDAHPLAQLVTETDSGIAANAVPLLYRPSPEGPDTLRGHLARANSQWRDSRFDRPALAIFQGPHAYVSPSWYAEKAATGRVVPTWNYSVLHVYGRLAIHDDVAWLRAFLTELTARHESGRNPPWAITDAPADYIERQLKGIVGFEMTIERIEAKAKLSQNRNEADRSGVVTGLRKEVDPLAQATGEQVAETLERPRG